MRNPTTTPKRISTSLTCAIATFFAFHLACATEIVVLDAGHSIDKPGAMGASGIPEVSYNLAVTAAVKTALESRHGIGTILTNPNGEGPSLEDRTRSTQGRLLVSIHHDSMQQSWIDAGKANTLKGFSVFVSAKNPSAQLSYVCAKHVASVMRDSGESPSLYHATPIKGENRPLLDTHLGIHQFDDLIVLKRAQSAAILIEVGVIVNPREAQRLASQGHIQKIGNAIAKGIANCVHQHGHSFADTKAL